MRSDKIPGNPRRDIADTCKEALAAMDSLDEKEFQNFFRSAAKDPKTLQSYVIYFMGLGLDDVVDKPMFDRRLLELEKLLGLRLKPKLYADILYYCYQIFSSNDSRIAEIRDGTYESCILLSDLERCYKEATLTDINDSRQIIADLELKQKALALQITALRIEEKKLAEGNQKTDDIHQEIIDLEAMQKDFAEQIVEFKNREQAFTAIDKQIDARIQKFDEQIQELEKQGKFLENAPAIDMVDKFYQKTRNELAEQHQFLQEHRKLIGNLRALKQDTSEYDEALLKLKNFEGDFKRVIKPDRRFAGGSSNYLVKMFHEQRKELVANGVLEKASTEWPTSKKHINPLLRGFVVNGSFVSPDERVKPSTKSSVDYLDLEASKAKGSKALPNKLLSLKEFLDQSCFHKQFGYYSNISDDLGFTTIASGYQTQLSFAASLLAKAVNHWMDSGKPENFVMLQLSGGNGELELAILSLAKTMADNQPGSWWGRFYGALKFRTIDVSESLSDRQKQVCEKYKDVDKGGVIKYDVIKGDATKPEAWNEVRKLQADAHFVFSNELLDMIFPEFYTLSEDGKIMKPYVMTKITDLNGFRNSVRQLFDEHSEAGLEFRKLFSAINLTLNQGPAPLLTNKTEAFIDKDLYESFMIFLHKNNLTENESITKYFEHVVVDFPVQLNVKEEEGLRARLRAETPAYVSDIGIGKKLFTDSLDIKKMYEIEPLKKQQRFDFDYFNGRNIRDIEMLRHYGGNVGRGEALMETPRGDVKFKEHIPSLVDSTYSVSDRAGIESLPHMVLLLSAKDEYRVDEITKVTGIDHNYFSLFSNIHREMRFVNASKITKDPLVKTFPSASVTGAETEKMKVQSASAGIVS